MADPITMMAVGGMAASGAGGVMSAFGSRAASEGKADMYRYQAAVADLNKKLAKEDADYTRAVGEVEVQKYGMKQAFLDSTIKTTQAAKGIDIDRGSAVDVRESQREVGLFDQSLIRSGAARKAYAKELEGVKAGLEGDQYRRAADQTEDAAEMSFYGSLIGTAGSVASKWVQWGGPSSYRPTATSATSSYLGD